MLLRQGCLHGIDDLSRESDSPQELLEIQTEHTEMLLVSYRQKVSALIGSIREYGGVQKGTRCDDIEPAVEGELFQERPCGRTGLDLIEEYQRLTRNRFETMVLQCHHLDDVIHIGTLLEDLPHTGIHTQVHLDTVIVRLGELPDDVCLPDLSLTTYQQGFVAGTVLPFEQQIVGFPPQHDYHIAIPHVRIFNYATFSDEKVVSMQHFQIDAHRQGNNQEITVEAIRSYFNG